jgi:hypothetical protein
MSTRLRVLDCFGTVVFAGTGRPDHRAMAAELQSTLGVGTDQAKKFVYPLVAHAWLAETPSLDVAGHVRGAAAALGASEDELLSFLWDWVGPGRETWVVPDAVPAALGALVDDGCELRMLTNCALTPAQLHQALEQVGLRRYFSVVMVSSSGSGKKPEAAWFERAFAGGFDDVAMVGDHRAFDIEPAEALGIPTVRITGPQDWDDPPALLRPLPTPSRS